MSGEKRICFDPPRRYTFDEYQDEARKTASYPNIGHNIIYPVLGLTGEAGEVSDKVKKLFRDHNGELSDAYKEALAKELGDCLWYLSALSDEIGYSLQSIAEMNNAKLRDRQRRGKLGGDGDDR